MKRSHFTGGTRKIVTVLVVFCLMLSMAPMVFAISANDQRAIEACQAAYHAGIGK